MYKKLNNQKILFSKFSHFSKYFLMMKLKNKVCSNLTTETLKFRLDLSRLSYQRFAGFLLSLLSKRSKNFFGNFWKMTKSYFEFQLKFAKKARLKGVPYYHYVICESLSSIWCTIWEEMVFAVWKTSNCYSTVPIGVMINDNLWCTFSQDWG